MGVLQRLATFVRIPWPTPTAKADSFIEKVSPSCLEKNNSGVPKNLF